MTDAFRFSDTFLVGDREPGFIPGSHAASKDTYRRKAFFVQYFCRSDRAAFLISDSDNWVRTVSRQVVKLCVEFG